MRAQHLQPDGTTLSVDFDSEQSLDPWQSQVHVNAPTDGRAADSLRRRTFHVTHRGNYDHMIADMFADEPPYREVQGTGEIVVYWNPHPDATQGLILWRGEHHEVQSYLPSLLAADGQKAAEYMAGLVFKDSVDGLVIEPTSLSGETVDVYESFTYIPEIADLTFHPPSVGLGFLPKWSGAKAPAGEVWKSTDTAAGADEPLYLILASEEAVCVVTPAIQDAATARRSAPDPLALVQSINSISLR